MSELLVCVACGANRAFVCYPGCEADDLFNGVKCTDCGAEDSWYFHGGDVVFRLEEEEV